MLPFIVLAIGEIFCGFFIYSWFDPQAWLDKNKTFIVKWNFNFDKLFFDLERDGAFIRKGNRLCFLILIILAIVTILNGILVVSYDFPDIKEILLVITTILIFPLRYFYIYRIRSSSESLQQ
jgi:hypothetical protein